MSKEQQLQQIAGQKELDYVAEQSSIELKPKEKFSDVAMDFAKDAAKTAKENPDAMKIENQSAADQVEFASRFFQMYFKQFNVMINRMNKKAAARVITRLVAYPLETPNDMTWVSKEEKDAFLIGNQLMETKYMLFKYVAMNEAEKAKLAQENKKVEEKNEIKEG